MIIDHAITVACIAAIPPTIVAALAVWSSHKNSKQITEVHGIINSKFAEFMKLAEDAAFAKGEKLGAKAEQEKALAEKVNFEAGAKSEKCK